MLQAFRLLASLWLRDLANRGCIRSVIIGVNFGDQISTFVIFILHCARLVAKARASPLAHRTRRPSKSKS